VVESFTKHYLSFDGRIWNLSVDVAENVRISPLIGFICRLTAMKEEKIKDVIAAGSF
jgi:hypothetical protein